MWGALGLLTVSWCSFWRTRDAHRSGAVPFSSRVTANTWGDAWTLRMPVATELFMCRWSLLFSLVVRGCRGVSTEADLQCNLDILGSLQCLLYLHLPPVADRHLHAQSCWKHFLGSWIQPTGVKSALKKVPRAQHFAAERSPWSRTDLVSALCAGVWSWAAAGTGGCRNGKRLHLQDREGGLKIHLIICLQIWKINWFLLALLNTWGFFSQNENNQAQGLGEGVWITVLSTATVEGCTEQDFDVIA